MRRTAAITLICSAIAFLAGYFIASRKTDSLVAQHQLSALMHYTPALAYLQKGQFENAKYILYVGTDDSLNTLSKDNARALNQADKEILENTLGHLNKSWTQDKPFDTEKSAPLRALPGWVEMRQKNDAFRQNFTNK